MAIEAGPDRERSYTADEERLLTERLVELTTEVHQGDGGPIVDRATLCALHRRLFVDVRSHAGRMRDHSGAEYLAFGPNRSVGRAELAAQLETVFRQLRRSLASFASQAVDAAYVRGGLHVAAWSHAELIRIHPFEDGNGRTSRLQMGSVLVALRLPPIAVEVVKQEYNAVLNHYFAAHRAAERQGHHFDSAAALAPLCALLQALALPRS